MADAGMSDEAVFDATGRDWAAWKAHLDAAGAAELDHAAIARWLKKEGIRPWWRQMVTVGYERMIGRREVGQTCTGSYAAGASKTFVGDKDAALSRWQELVAERAEFAGALAAAEPRVTATEKWRYWRVDLDDGTRVSVGFSDKTGAGAGGKATIGVQHEKLADAEAVAAAKLFWKELLSEA